MAHLMKLELKKLPYGRYILLAALAILLSMYFVLVALYDTSDGVYTFENTFRVVEMIFAFVFILFFAVLNVSLVISEYSNKTILLMFTYPVDRKKLIAAKLLLTTLFIATSMAVGYILCGAFLVGLDRRYDLLAGEFSPQLLQSWLAEGAATVVVFCCLGLWTFAAGMLKKSATVTLVSAVGCVLFRQLVITAGENNRETAGFVLFMLAATAAVLWYTFAKSITRLD